MAILDTLTVQLLMDSGNLVKGAKQAEEGLAKTDKAVGKAGKSLEEVGKKGADSFAAFRREALGAIALFTGGAGIASFTHDIAAANTALGNLSRQLDIAPQKLTQLHEAAKAAGVNPGDIDGLFKGVQNKYASSATRGELMQLSAFLGVNPVDQNGHVRGDLLDQIAHSKVFLSSSRAVQDRYLEDFGGSASLNNLVSRPDYDALKKRFAGLGPSREQIRQGEQLLSDWTELKANTDQVMQRVFSELEPSLHNFLQAMIAIEKAHPQEIADGVAGIAAALSVLSGVLTAKSFLKVFGALSGAGKVITGGIGSTLGLGAVYGVAKTVMNDVSSTGRSPWDTGVGELYASQAKTGSGGVDLDRLTGAVAMQESHGNPNAYNPKSGAAGALQFIPSTYRWLGGKNPYDLDESWQIGQKYLGQLLAKYHDLSKSLAAYNWGPGNLDKDISAHGDNWRSFLPAETSDYLNKVGRNYATGNIVHHNTTHAPNISIAINGAGKTAHEIAQEVARSLPQQMAQNDQRTM
ncbi:transglycosylase SLT domain-containing protein [Bombella saccharophila]|uniref:Transglycosylase SLT domain-containing protein n=1 Tax=Bombella saccharophila TaxID=2967338 RepID=A0ABT3W5V7_9PROT|nr:transglycosylase SLT domain-containing protein [Bombella saccharophila]MCX5614442.1 transglycosylase SLT domain-containing protein [Bombella saccharophila]